METKTDNTIEKTIGLLNNPALMTVCLKRDWKTNWEKMHPEFTSFFILVEKCNDGGLNYAEYNFDLGEQPRDIQILVETKEKQPDIQLLVEKKHANFDSFSNRICKLKSANYEVIFSQAMEVEKVNAIILDSKKCFTTRVVNLNPIWFLLEGVLFDCGIRNLSSNIKKPCSIQTFQNYLTSIAIVLMQGQRQNTSLAIPDDCIDTIWFYTMNGFLDTDVFKEKNRNEKNISRVSYLRIY